MKKKLPWLLVYTRILLTTFAVLFGYWKMVGAPYILLLLVAAATDYYDGVLARKFGVETATLRQWDSIADTIFFIGVCIGIWFAYPQFIIGYKWGITAILLIEAIRYIFDWFKFKRGASYHAFSAKIFGVALLIATIAIMGFGKAFPALDIALALGIISELEGLTISVVLKKWTYNVKHIGTAIKLSTKQKLSQLK